MGAVENIITDNLPIWSSSVQSKSSSGRGTSSKRTLYGVKKLRELILDLAVRGLLVPQDPNDEPASVLLEKIAAEKEQLIKDGKIKKQKTSLEYLGREDVYKLPAGWSWTLLGNIVGIIRGVTYRKPDASDAPRQDTKPLLRANNIQRELNFEKLLYIPNNLIKSEQFIKKHDFLIAMSSGSANLVGKSVLVKEDLSMTFGAFCAILRPYKSSVSRYLNNFLSSPVYRLQAQGSGKGIGIQNLNTAALQQILIPIPPDVEQDKIANKVDELMALCDTLEQQQEDSIQAHEALVEALLEALTSAADADVFQAAWQRVSEHFDVLFTTEHSIDKLKETILQLAVMGKLVPQDPNDEPASVLLEKISIEKERLTKGGQIKEQKSLPSALESELNFELPSGWQLARLQECFDVRDGTHDSPKEALSGKTYPLVTSKNFVDDGIDFDNAKHISEVDHLEIIKRSRVEVDDVLFSMIGGNIGKQVIVRDARPFSIKNVALFKYYDKECTFPKFFKKYCEHLAVTLQSKASGGSQPFVSLGLLRKLAIALPPIMEQRRIVTKIDELIALCDQLKDSLQQAQKTQIHLTDAVVENAL